MDVMCSVENNIPTCRIPSDHRIRLNLDGGYMGIQDYLLGVTAKVPHKKPKGGKLTATKKAQNKAHSKRRVFSYRLRVEAYTICRERTLHMYYT